MLGATFLSCFYGAHPKAYDYPPPSYEEATQTDSFPVASPMPVVTNQERSPFLERATQQNTCYSFRISDEIEQKTHKPEDIYRCIVIPSFFASVPLMVFGYILTCSNARSGPILLNCGLSLFLLSGVCLWKSFHFVSEKVYETIPCD